MAWAILRGLALAGAIVAGAFHAVPAAAQINDPRMWQLHDLSSCLTVPNGNYAAGVQLTVARCANLSSQVFVFRDTGHFVANGGNPVSDGNRMCVEARAGAIVLMPCRRLTTGDRQWWRRDVWGFIQNNSRGNTECIGVPRLNYSEGTGLVVRGCWENRHASWSPAPYTELDRIRDEAGRRANPDYRPNTVPTYDPEVRSRWEDMSRQYGPYHEIRDSRTGHCIVPGQLLGTLVTGYCGKGHQRFHVSREGMLYEVRQTGGYRDVTGRCVTAPTAQGGVIRLTACNRNNRAQRWWVHREGQVQSQSAGNYCLDIKNEARNLGAQVIGWRCDTNRPPHQAFRITREDKFPT